MKHTIGSVRTLFGVVHIPPFHAWLGNSRVILAAASEAVDGLNLAMKAPVYPTRGLS